MAKEKDVVEVEATKATKEIKVYDGLESFKVLKDTSIFKKGDSVEIAYSRAVLWKSKGLI